MAVTTSKEIVYRDQVDFIEHVTGKKVLSWRHAMERAGTIFHFTDKTMMFVDYGGMIDMENIVYEPLPRTVCLSCGGDMHAGYFDWKGRCEHTVKHFWERVRKVYWHRYSKNK